MKDFEVQAKLGEGSFGTVYKVRDLKNGQALVMKQIQVNSGNPGELNDKLNECSVIKDLRHPYICWFRQYILEKGQLNIFMDYCDHGDLQNFIDNQKGFKISENRVKRFALEILLGIDFLHE